MKFNDLVFLAEMDYSNIPGEVSQQVRDASLGDEPPGHEDFTAVLTSLKRRGGLDNDTIGSAIHMYLSDMGENGMQITDETITGIKQALRGHGLDDSIVDDVYGEMTRSPAQKWYGEQ